MAKSIYASLIFLLLYACGIHPSKIARFEISPINYLALGDSYTIGESVEEKERWPVVLANHLSELGYKTKPPTIIAKTGWTTDELQDAISKAELLDEYDLVTLLIGVNNQYRGYDINQFEKEFGELLDFAIDKAGNQPKKVVVVSIPDWGVMPFAKERDSAQIALEIDQYNQLKEKITKRKGADFVDITVISRIAKNQPDFIASDGLHPSGNQYDLWVRRIMPIVLNNIKWM